MSLRGGAVALGLVLLLGAATPAGAATVSTLQLDGVISPIAVRLVSGAIERAKADGATKVLCTIQQSGSVALEDRCKCV